MDVPKPTLADVKMQGLFHHLSNAVEMIREAGKNLPEVTSTVCGCGEPLVAISGPIFETGAVVYDPWGNEYYTDEDVDRTGIQVPPGGCIYLVNCENCGAWYRWARNYEQVENEEIPVEYDYFTSGYHDKIVYHYAKKAEQIDLDEHLAQFKKAPDHSFDESQSGNHGHAVYAKDWVVECDKYL